MGFRCGIIGLPNVGKSTIFNALTSSQIAASENFPFCTIEPNTGTVLVPDGRLQDMAKIVNPQRIFPASVEFVDIAGLVKGAAKGEGLGNKFLGHIRNVDALVHIVRCFEDKDVVHVEGGVDPLRDIEIIQAELILADLETVSQVSQRLSKQSKAGGKEVLEHLEILKSLESHLDKGLPAISFIHQLNAQSDPKIFILIRDMHLLTAKKTMYVCNTAEDTPEDNPLIQVVREFARKEKAECMHICGKIEAELSQLEESERLEMLSALNLAEPGLHTMIRKGYHLLDLQTYFTAGEKEVRAWTISRGDKAPQAAGKIHSDFERGFIRAEVFKCSDLLMHKSKNKLKELGLVRVEGKDYVVQDGDVMEFRFNV